MAMSFECAVDIVVARQKIVELMNKALDENDDSSARDAKAKLDQLRPYAKEANDIVMTESDKDFAAEAKKLTAAIKPINDAISDFKKINEALKTAADLIDKILKLIGVLAKI